MMWFALPPVGIPIAVYGAVHGTIGAILGRKEKIRYVEKQRKVEELFVVTEKIRSTSEREVVEVWKVVAGDIAVFKGFECGPWEKVGDDEILERSYRKHDQPCIDD